MLTELTLPDQAMLNWNTWLSVSVIIADFVLQCRHCTFKPFATA